MRVGVVGHDLLQAGAGGGHAERVAAYVPTWKTVPSLTFAMISSLPPMAPQGVPPAIALPRVTMSGTTPQRSTAPPRAVQMPTLTSSKMRTMPCFLVSVAHALEEAGLGQHDAEVHHGGLHDERGRRIALLDHALDALGHVLDVVERHRDGEVDGALRDAGAVGQRGVVVARADLAVVERRRC